MRIAYVTRQFPPDGIGGIGSYVDTLAGLMADAGHDVTVVTAAPGIARSSKRRAGFVVERFPVVGPNLLWRCGSRLWPMLTPRAQAALSAWRAMRRLGGRFDVIEVPEWRAEGLLLRAGRAGAVVAHLHLAHELVRRWDDMNPPYSRDVAIAEWMERTVVGRATAVTATSRISAALPDGAPWRPSTLVHLVPPPIIMQQWASCPSVLDTAPVVLFVGHLEHRKAPEILLSALGTLAQEIPDLSAIFVGKAFTGPGGRPFDEYLRAEASKLGVACEVLGPRSGGEEMRSLYARARVVAVPSRYETLSMVALEALACGRPAVVTHAVGASEYFGDELAGLLIPPSDPLALADALRPLLQDGRHARRMGELGRRAVAARCAASDIVDKRIAAYEAALEACRASRYRGYVGQT